MLAAALRSVADRLVATLATLAARVHAAATQTRSADPFPSLVAPLLYLRLTALITRIANLGAQPLRALPSLPSLPALPSLSLRQPVSSLGAGGVLPRRPGWLLEALPDTAPAIADDLARLLADPATATLLGQEPTLARALRPVLRALGLSQALSAALAPPARPQPATPAASAPATAPPPASPIAPPPAPPIAPRCRREIPSAV